MGLGGGSGEGDSGGFQPNFGDGEGVFWRVPAQFGGVSAKFRGGQGALGVSIPISGVSNPSLPCSQGGHFGETLPQIPQFPSALEFWGPPPLTAPPLALQRPPETETEEGEPPQDPPPQPPPLRRKSSANYRAYAVEPHAKVGTERGRENPKGPQKPKITPRETPKTTLKTLKTEKKPHP